MCYPALGPHLGVLGLGLRDVPTAAAQLLRAELRCEGDFIGHDWVAPGFYEAQARYLGARHPTGGAGRMGVASVLLCAELCASTKTGF